MSNKLNLKASIEKAVSFTIEEIKGKANIFKATSKLNGNTNELMVFALDDDQFNKVIQKADLEEEGHSKLDRVIHELK